MRFRLVVSEAVRSITANLSTTVAATMTVLIGMFLLGLFIALGTWVLSWSDHVKSELLVKVYFTQEATPTQINQLRVTLESNPQIVQSVTFVSADEALTRMKQKFPELTENLVSNPLPASFEVLPTNGEYVDEVSALMRPVPAGVEKVNDGNQTSRRILQVARVIELVFLIAILVLLTASTLLIANTIRLSIFSRRREIEVMKLVGATNWFVRGPFMLEGLLCGLVGAAVAVLLLFVGKEVALPAILGRVDAGSSVQAISFLWNAVILLLVGLLLGAAGSGMTLRKFLRV